MKNTFTCFLSVLLILSFIPGAGNAQGIKRQNIGSYGSGGNSDGLFIGQTIGQPFFTSGYYDNQVGLIPGFQQPLVFSISTVKQIPVLTRLGVFPNPAISIVNIETPEVVENAIVRITDISGRVIWEERIPEFSSYQMDCSRWQSGLYFITVFDVNKRFSYLSKVIISK